MLPFDFAQSILALDGKPIRGERVRRLRGLGLPPVLENISARDALLPYRKAVSHDRQELAGGCPRGDATQWRQPLT